MDKGNKKGLGGEWLILRKEKNKSILLIFRIDRFMQDIVLAQKEVYRQILENTKEIHNTIADLNQQKREYYFFCIFRKCRKNWQE